MRRRTALFRTMIAFALASLMAVPSVMAAPQQQSAAQPAAADNRKPGMYNGPGGCAASNCHGSVQPRSITRIPQNEYSIWAAQDKHSRSFMVLSNPVSLRMGKILKINAPNTEHKCLACHALDVPENVRAATFKLEDGVSCENCHGPAVGWLGQHTTRGWTHEQSLKLGMYDTRNLVKRSETCVSCHVGTAEKQVDHEMIAAGHPDLTFELDTFSSAMPRHWKSAREKEPWSGVQEWGVGQAVQLREALNRLDRHAGGSNWPEYSDLECFSCHHSLTRPEDSWRQAHGYEGRPGNPSWNPSRYVVFRHLASTVNKDTATKLDAELEKLEELVNKRGDRAQIQATAKEAAQLADTIAEQLDKQQYDRQLTARIMQAIATDSANIAYAGERSAEQAAMALDSLVIAYDRNAKEANQQELRAAVNRLFDDLRNPSAYNAPQFASQMQKVRVLLPAAGEAAAVSH